MPWICIGPIWPTPLEALRRLGGFEIAAMTGAYVACAQAGLPALVDGFIAGVAALTAVRLCPGAGDWLLYAHRSAEPGHALVLAALGAEPLLDLGMRLGEGSGAAVAVPLLRLACALHGGMATFAEAQGSAGVSRAWIRTPLSPRPAAPWRDPGGGSLPRASR